MSFKRAPSSEKSAFTAGVQNNKGGEKTRSCPAVGASSRRAERRLLLTPEWGAVPGLPFALDLVGHLCELSSNVPDCGR